MRNDDYVHVIELLYMGLCFGILEVRGFCTGIRILCEYWSLRCDIGVVLE